MPSRCLQQVVEPLMSRKRISLQIECINKLSEDRLLRRSIDRRRCVRLSAARVSSSCLSCFLNYFLNEFQLLWKHRRAMDDKAGHIARPIIHSANSRAEDPLPHVMLNWGRNNVTRHCSELSESGFNDISRLKCRRKSWRRLSDNR